MKSNAPLEKRVAGFEGCAKELEELVDGLENRSHRGSFVFMVYLIKNATNCGGNRRIIS